MIPPKRLRTRNQNQAGGWHTEANRRTLSLGPELKTEIPNQMGLAGEPLATVTFSPNYELRWIVRELMT